MASMVLLNVLLVFLVSWVTAKDWRCEGIQSTSGFDDWCSEDKRVLLDLSDDTLIDIKCINLEDLQESTYDTFGGIYVKLGTNSVDWAKSSSCTIQDNICELILDFDRRLIDSSLHTQRNDTRTTCFVEDVLHNINNLSIASTLLVSVLPTFLDGIVNLEDLDLHENYLETLPPGLFSSTSRLRSLDIGDNYISYLDPSIFNNLIELENLHLCGNPLVSLPNTLFHSLINLKVLNLYTCSLESLPADVFYYTRNLRHLSLFRNEFSSIPEGLFKNTPLLESILLKDNTAEEFVLPKGLLSYRTHLARVDLSDSNLYDLPEDLLLGSTSLVELNLQYNHLTTLPANLLINAENLQTLDVSWNNLTTIPDGAFASLTSLKTLNLSHNRLVTIQEFLFSRLSNVMTIRLESNQLKYIHPKAFPKECFILDINLSSNQLHFNSALVSPFDQCRLLKTLSLANNSLSTYGYEWTNMEKLTSLDLSHNNITKLTFRHMDFISKKVSLNLINNKIQHINVETMELYNTELIKHIILMLEGNPIACDCNLDGFLELIANPRHMNVTIDKVICSTPDELSGRLLRQIHSKNVTCEIPINCPEPCVCKWKPADGAFIVNCSNQRLHFPPKQLPWNDTWKYTEVHLQRNRLQFLPNMSLPGYGNVTKVFAAYNNITMVEPYNLSPKLQVLELNDNKLTTKGLRSAFEFLSNKNWNLTQVKLKNNNWVCDCNARDLLNFLHAHRTKVDNVTCLDGRRLMPLSPEDICTITYKTIIAISTSVAVVGLLVGALATLYLHYSREVKVWLYSKKLCLWFVTEEELDKDKEYDAFICYSHKDNEFVENYLVPGLESGPHKFKLCLHIRDWVPGEWITTQIVRSVKSSRRTVIVLSPNFLESVWGLQEFRTAHQQTISDGTTRTIILLYGDLGTLDNLDPELRGYLSTYTYIKWNDPWFWKKMYFALPHSQLRNRSVPQHPNKMLLSAKDTKTNLSDEGKGKFFNPNGYIPGIKDPNFNIDAYTLSAFPRLKPVHAIENEYIFN